MVNNINYNEQTTQSQRELQPATGNYTLTVK